MAVMTVINIMTSFLLLFASGSGSVIDEINTKLSVLASNVNRLERKLFDMETTIVKMNEKIQTIDEKQNESHTSMTEVAFSAYRDSPAEFQPLEPIIFLYAWANLGDHYNTDTGIFTCPVIGLYYFSYSIYIRDSNSFDLELVREGARYAAAYAEKDLYDQGSISVIIPCDEGNEVWLRQAAAKSALVGEVTTGGLCTANSFTGFLLHQF